ncbi:protein kinase [Streptomyces spinoverrucosus]|uniref:WD40 repeat domain-containing serine/threonine protein kinase n=1 Tax=Streptomyces spinoverrucosus TaxID=284043 RepID=UPI0018C41013|nr:serine/threonine-protein kinase [Streptomyces spinoverrucosus]MBG0853671.1 protein kinase [Streptomyces spinoverrucosus]
MSGAESAAGAPTQWTVGRTVDGRYHVREVAGKGTMGQVLRVWHKQWEIDLAVKCPNADWFETDAQKALFVAEAEAWVSLGLHPNICGCHYVRSFDDVPRVFAEYVSGGSLHDWIADRRLYADDRDVAVARVLDVAVQIAWGLGHAHSRNLVHQDVKPENVLLGDHDDSMVTAKVTDFGLARARRVADPSTATGDASPETSNTVSFGGMTKAYASPEQMARRHLDRRTDIFSFAASVLEMFAGGVRWGLGPEAGSFLARYRAGAFADATLPPIPPRLADLLERCLTIDASARPGSMTDVAAEIAGIYRSVTGRTYPRLEPQEADLRGDELNNRALSFLDLARPDDAEAAFASALSADPQHAEATYNVGLMRWRRGEITDEDVITDLQAVRRDTEDSWSARHVLGLAHLERGDLRAARPLLERADPEVSGRPDVRAALESLDSGVVDAQCLAMREIRWVWTRPGWADPMLKVDVSADGRRAVTGGVDDEVRVWDVLTGRCLHTLGGHSKGIHSVRITPDGRYAASTGGDNTARLWDLSDGTCLRAIRTAGSLAWAALSARTGVAVGLEYTRHDGRPGAALVVWDLRSRQVRWRLDQEVEQFVRAELSPDGRWVLVAGYKDCVARVWDLRTGRSRHVFGSDGVNQSALGFDLDAGVAAIGNWDSTIDIWHLPTGRQTRTLTGHTRIVKSLALASDGKRLLSGAVDGTVRLWDVDTGQCLRTFRGHDGDVCHVQWGLNDQYALSAGQDNAIRLWRTPSAHTAPPQLSRPREHRELSERDEKVEALVDEAARLAAAGDRTTALVRLREARKVPGHERAPKVMAAWRSLSRSAARIGLRAVWTVRSLAGHESAIMSVDVTADGRIAVSGGIDGTLRLWDVESGRCLRTIANPKRTGAHRAVDVVQLSADGTRVMASGRDGSAHAWSVDTGQLLYSVDGERLIAVDTSDPLMRMIGPMSRGARSARFSADGRRALIGGADRSFRLWDLERGTCLRTLTGHRGPVQSAWIGSDGRLAATAGADAAVRLWDLFTGHCTRVLLGHTHWTMATALSGDGRLAVSAGGYEDRTIRVWDVATGDCVAVLDEHLGNAKGIRFTPDGRYVVSGAEDTTLRIWDIASGRCVRAVEAHPGGVESVALTGDGHFVVSGGSDGVVRLWALDWELDVG